MKKNRYKKDEIGYLLGVTLSEDDFQGILTMITDDYLYQSNDNEWKKYNKYFIVGIDSDEYKGIGTSLDTIRKIREDFKNIPVDNLWIVVDEIRFGCGEYGITYRIIDRENSNTSVFDDIRISRSFAINTD